MASSFDESFKCSRRVVRRLAICSLWTAACGAYAADPACGKTVMGKKILCGSALPLPVSPPQAVPATPQLGNGGIASTMARQRAYNQCLARHRADVTISLADTQKCWRLLKG